MVTSFKVSFKVSYQVAMEIIKHIKRAFLPLLHIEATAPTNSQGSL